MDRLFDCHEIKRQWLLSERKFDLRDMADVFSDQSRLDYQDTRFDYGEIRRVTIGKAVGGIFTVIYTERHPVTWLITAWPSNRKERERYENR